jgi:hypothetical protein
MHLPLPARPGCFTCRHSHSLQQAWSGSPQLHTEGCRVWEYRYYVSGCARGTGVAGYVKNLPGGSVMVVAEGSREALDAFTSLLRAPGGTW